MNCSNSLAGFDSRAQFHIFSLHSVSKLHFLETS